jgi:integrase
MCSWLVEEHYLLVNPFHGLQKLDSTKPLVDVTGRTLTHAQWRFVLQTVSRPLNLPGGSAAAQRDYFALLLAYATGLRRTELATATTGALSRKALDAALEDAWTLRVMGKGRRERQVPMPHRLMETLVTSLQLRPTPCTLETARRHTADRPPENRPAAVAGCARAALQGHLHAGRRPATARVPGRSGGSGEGQHPLAAAHPCEPRARRRRRPAGRADGARPRQSRHDDALHQRGRGTPVPGRGAVF